MWIRELLFIQTTQKMFPSLLSRLLCTTLYAEELLVPADCIGVLNLYKCFKNLSGECGRMLSTSFIRMYGNQTSSPTSYGCHSAPGPRRSTEDGPPAWSQPEYDEDPRSDSGYDGVPQTDPGYDEDPQSRSWGAQGYHLRPILVPAVIAPPQQSVRIQS